MCWTGRGVRVTLEAAKDNRYGHRDAAMILVAYRHAGLSVAVLESQRIGRQVTGRSTAKITCQHGLIYRHLIEHGDTSAESCRDHRSGKANVRFGSILLKKDFHGPR